MAAKPKKTPVPQTSGERLAAEVADMMKRWPDKLAETEAGSNDQWAGALICKAADKHGLYPKDVVLFPHILAKYGLTVKECTPAAVLIATQLDRFYNTNSQQVVAGINRMSALVTLQRAWIASGLDTVEAYLATVQPKLPEPVAQTPVTATIVASDQPGKASNRKGLIYGFPATAVLRWMGSEGWTREMAGKVLTHFGIDVSPATVQIQMKAGQTRDTTRGEPAKLTPGQANDIYEIL